MTKCHIEKTAIFEVISYGSCSNGYSSVAWAHNLSYLTSTWVVLINNIIDLRLSFALKKSCFIFTYAYVAVTVCLYVHGRGCLRRSEEAVGSAGAGL